VEATQSAFSNEVCNPLLLAVCKWICI
jgi:hypothetical protein